LLEQFDHRIESLLQFLRECMRLAVEVPLDLTEQRPLPKRDMPIERTVSAEVDAGELVLEVECPTTVLVVVVRRAISSRLPGGPRTVVEGQVDADHLVRITQVVIVLLQ